jgi:large subunit ribosomal protein L23
MDRKPMDIIRRPLLTEKSNWKKETDNQVYFEVDMDANKVEIAKAVEALWNVHVEKVNTQVVRGKVKRLGRNLGKRPNWKKAIVTLKKGDNIDFFQGTTAA